MTPLVEHKLRTLAGVLADLKVRVRDVLATELGRHLAQAVGEVVHAVLAGSPLPAPRTPHRSRQASPWDDDADVDWGRPRDPWVDPDPDPDEYGYVRPPTGTREREVRGTEPQSVTPATATTAAIAAGVTVGRWWLARHGSLAAAAGLGLAVGLLGVAGGPVARTAVVLLAGVSELLAATDALGDGSARLAEV